MTLLISKYDTVIQEMPDHISLAFYCKGCSLRCKGCHSPELQTLKHGILLTNQLFYNILENYNKYITNVLFFGGEWEEQRLIELLDIVRSLYPFLKITLWTGLDYNEVSPLLLGKLDYIKTGRYDERRGDITNPNTNQKLIDINNFLDITSRTFHKQ